MKNLILFLSLFAFAVGCSSSSSSGNGNSGANAAGGGGTGANGTGATPLTKQPWCVNAQTETGYNYQVRIELRDDKSVRYTEYGLLEDGSRGGMLEDEKGTYTLNGEMLAVMLKGVPTQYQIRLDPTSETGAPRLWIGETAFDPCL